MKKLATIIGSGVLSLTVLVAMSGRGFQELFGYVKATADTTVNEMESSVPASVRDQKVRNDIEQARGDVIDRRVKLSLVESEIQRLTYGSQQSVGSGGSPEEHFGRSISYTRTGHEWIADPSALRRRRLVGD